MTSLLTAKQDQALTNLLQGLVAREVAEKLHAASELVARMNRRLDTITTSHGIGVSLRWRRRDDLDPDLAGTIDLLATPPDLRTAEQDAALHDALSARIDTARREAPAHGHGVEEEALLYLIHGLLHLNGYIDLKEPDRTEMHRVQEEILQALR